MLPGPLLDGLQVHQHLVFYLSDVASFLHIGVPPTFVSVTTL